MRSPLIGISCGNVPHNDWDEQTLLDRDVLNRSYSEAVARAGGMAFILPMTRALIGHADADDLPPMTSCGPGALHFNARTYMERIDALLLSGGRDIAPQAADMSEAHLCQQVDHARDIWESALLAAALDMNKPVLGICRGLQLINCALGGTLWLDLAKQRSSDIHHQQKVPRSNPSHKVTISSESRLASIVNKSETMVNSGHHQGIKQLASPLIASAHSDDGLIEAIEHQQANFVIGVQWHPEGMLQDQNTQAIFSAFINAAKGSC